MKDWHKLRPELFKKNPYYLTGCDTVGFGANINTRGSAMLKMRQSAKLACIISSLIIGVCGVAQAETLRIGGTGVALGGMTLLGAAFEEQNPGTEVVVLPSLGSSGGIKALIAGAIDLSVSSRPLKEAEEAKGVQGTLYATTPLALVTSANTNADAMTTDSLAKIYAGDLTEWSSGEPIRLVLRPMSETDTKIVGGLSDAVMQAIEAAHERPGLLKATNDQENAEMLERLAGSLGAVAMGQIATEKRQLKILPLNGITPQPGVLSEQDTAFSKSLYIVKTESPSALAAKFFDFVFSEEAQSILVATDHMPAG